MRRALRTAPLLLLLVLVGGGTEVARAQEAPTFGGLQGTAASTGLRSFYNPEGALPLGPLVEIGVPDALATITSGPATFARAAAADPGDIIANPDAIFTLASPDYPQGTIPPYPYRVSATSGFGEPSAESSPAPGLGARVEATEEGSTARATMPRADAPAVATFGTITAFAETSTADGRATVHVRSEMSEFALLEVITIDSVVTDLTASSDGSGVELTGGTTVTGASVGGQPVQIGPSGVSPAPINEVLSRAGIRISLAEPVKQGGESSGQLGSAGLRIDLDLSERTVPALSALGAIPSVPTIVPDAPSLADVVALARARQLSTFEIAGGRVALTVTGVVSDDALGDLGSVDTGGFGGDTLGAIDVGLGTLTPTADPVTAADRPETPALAARLASAPLGAGIGALGLLALLVQPLLGGRLARAVAAILAADDAASCQWEER